MQFHRTDLDKGFALIFKRNTSGGDTFQFAPRALDPKARYALSFQSGGSQAVYTGAELARGIKINLTSAPDAEMILYEKQP